MSIANITRRESTLGNGIAKLRCHEQKKVNSMINYSLSHIVQITDFWDFLHEYCKENSETFTEF